MEALRLSASDQQKLMALARAMGLTPNEAVRLAIGQALERLQLEVELQQFTPEGEALSNAEAEQIAVEAVRAVRKGHR